MDPRARVYEMDVEQQRRIAENEARFREVNERMRAAVDEFREDHWGELTLMCECAISECNDMIEIGREAYEHVRSDPKWFMVLPDHLIPTTEKLAEKHDAYWIAEKVDEGARVAESTA